MGSWVPSSTPSPNLPRVPECSTACQRQESNCLRRWYLQRGRAFPAIIAAFLRRNQRVYAGGRGWGGRALPPGHRLGPGHLPSRPLLLHVPVVLENVLLSLSCPFLVATSPGVPEAGPQQLHLSLYLGGEIKNLAVCLILVPGDGARPATLGTSFVARPCQRTRLLTPSQSVPSDCE